MYIFLTLATILFLILTTSIKIKIRYDNIKICAFLVICNVIKIDLIAKTKKAKKKSNFKYRLTKKIDFQAAIQIIKDSEHYLKLLLSKLKLQLRVKLEYGVSAPDKTALLYGICNAVVYDFDILLRNYFKKVNSNFEIIPDFNNKKLQLEFDITLSTRLYSLLFFAIKSVKFIKKYKSYFKKGGALNVRSSNRRVSQNCNG